MRDLAVAFFFLSLLYTPVSCRSFPSSPTLTSLPVSVILPFTTSASAVLNASISSHHSKQICHFPSLRDQMFYLEYIGYILTLVTNSLNWFLIIRYETENRSQSNSYLICLLLNYIPLCFFPSKKYSTWEKIKLATGIIVSGISIVIDSGFYYHFGHSWFCLGFVIAECISAILVRFSERVGDIMKIISGGSNLLSAMILIIGFLWNTGWNYAGLEVLAAFLGAAYTQCGWIDACDTTNSVLLELATIARIVYGFLLIYRSTIRGVLLWGCWNLCFSEEENLNRESRHFRSLGDIGKRIQAGMKKIGGDISTVVTFLLDHFLAISFKLGLMKYPPSPAQGQVPPARGKVPPARDEAPLAQDHRGELELM